MKKAMMFVVAAVFGMGICCYAGATQAKDDKAKAPANAAGQNEMIEEVVVIEGVAFTDNCAKNPKSSCVKDGKCVCKDKTACKNCKDNLKKCDAATQAKCQKALKDGSKSCPEKKNCPKTDTKSMKDGKACPKADAKKDSAAIQARPVFYVAQMDNQMMNNTQKTNQTVKDGKMSGTMMKDGKMSGTMMKDGKMSGTMMKDGKNQMDQKGKSCAPAADKKSSSSGMCGM